MITKPTVLVLGAGASQPYGFPVGQDLRRRILKPNEHLDKFAFDGTFHCRQTAEWFRGEFRRSQCSSIDAFLTHAKPNAVKYGKRLIASRIACCEDEEKLFPDDGDWMRVLFEIMGRGATPDTFGDNQLSVVTFNYDRSFELKLYWHLRSQYRHEPPDAASFVNEWPIYHVHGSLGPCFFPDIGSGDGRIYKATLDCLHDIESRILLVHDELEASETLEKARQAVAAAERVVFLGFGFHELNCKRLLNRGRGPTSCWRASCFNMTEAERLVAAKLVPLRPGMLAADAFNQSKKYVRYGEKPQDPFDERVTIRMGSPTWNVQQFLRENCDFLID